MLTGINNVIVPYEVDTGSDGNMLLLHIYKKLFPRKTREQLAAIKSKGVQFKMYNKTTITQLGTCTVEIEHKNSKE